MIDFPNSPALNQTFNASNGATYQWNGTVWVPVGAGGSLTTSDTPPSSPGPGQLWWNSVLGQLMIWYSDGTSSQWVPASPVPMLGGGTGEVTVVDGASGNGLPINVDSVLPFNLVKAGNAGGWWSASTFRYTPPAGKYLICVSYTIFITGAGAGSWLLKLRKNGNAVTVAVPSFATGGASWSAAASLPAYVDASGTDYFDVTANPNASGCTTYGGTFTAIPLTGMQGPMGPVGNIGQRIHGGFGAGSLPTGAWNALGYTVSSNDTGVNPVGNNWTPPAGRWLVGANLQMSGPTGASNVGLGLGINGTVSNSQGIMNSPTSGALSALCVQDVVDFDGATSMCWMGYSANATGSVTAQSWWNATRIK